MAENVKVSIIVPVYNTEKYLNRCVNSLLGQTLNEIEIILIDDLSTDGSFEIIKGFEQKYPEKVFAYKLAKKGRQGGARNFGMRYARGKYIGFVDSDDFIDTTMYETLYNLAEKYDTDMTCCNLSEYYEHKIVPQKKICLLGNSEELISIDMENRNEFLCEMRSFCLGIYKRNLIIDNDIFFPENLAYEDNYFGVAVRYFVKRYAYTNKNLYYYNRENNLSTTSIRNSSHHLDRIQVAQMTLDWLKEKSDYNSLISAAEYIYLEHFYIHTISCVAYYYDKVDYKLVKKIRNIFLKEFPEYKKNQFYIKKFPKIKRIIFTINEFSPHLYICIYRIFRKLKK